MRMWMLNPKLMCAQHLLGEHVELHMLVATIRLGKRLDGYIQTGLIEIHNITARHHALVQEMKRRGFKHASPLPRFNAATAGKINRTLNRMELSRRCKRCRALMAHRT